MPGVFISYRRDDTGGAAGRLYDRLRAHFGTDRVFRDIDTIAPGEPFDRRIVDRLARADVLLALIGPSWASCTDADGRPRLHAPHDFVRLEIGTALARSIPVIPVLLGNARMPAAGDLPPELEPLTRRQAIEIDEADFHQDVDRLIAALRPLVKRPAAVGARAALPAAAALLLGVVTLIVAGLLLSGRGSPGAEEAAPPGESAEVAVPRLALRHTPAAVSPAEARAVIVTRGFFSASSNPAGRGITHAFRTVVTEGWPVVVDGATGLAWEQGGSGLIVQGGRTGAEAYVARLNARRAGGFDDWRLPTLDEALSLMAPGAHDGFQLDPVFPARAAPFIWTADDSEPGRGWVVYFADGVVVPEVLALSAYVRAVRSSGA